MFGFGADLVVTFAVVALSVGATHAAPVDCDAARCTIASEIDDACPCGDAPNHSRYTSCVARIVNRAAHAGRIPKRCRGKINGCYIRSLCGKRSGVVLCEGPADGVSGRCRPIASDGECTRRGGTVVGTCCDACGGATPTPTASESSPTPTPGVPVATPTPSAVSATPTPVLGPTGPTAAPTVSAVATATAGPTVSAVATITAGPTGSPSSAATATASAAAPTVTTTVTAAAPTTTVTGAVPTVTRTVLPPTGTPTLAPPLPTATFETPIGSATSAPTSTPTPSGSPLFVDLDGDPDDGPPPLAVQFTNDVSGGTPPYMYRWNFGDGSPEVADPNPMHVYQQLGDFTATLTVKDAAGAEESEELDITVENE